MKRRFATTLAALVAMLASSGAWAASQTPAATQPSSRARPASLDEVVARIDEQLGKILVAQKIAGMSVVVIHDQDVLLARGYGHADLASKAPADKATVYRVGSITKVFTATALMQLRDAGKLNLDDPIEKYVPEFKIKSRFPDARPVTFRQVASHYSGLPTEAPLPYSYQDVSAFPRTEELIAGLEHSELQVPANTRSLYSNLGYNILGLAIERIARRPYADYVTERILQPLGMKHTGFVVTEELGRLLATGYRAANESGAHEIAPYADHGLASGMLYSSVEDMAELLKLQFREGPAGGRQILGSSALREMTAPLFVANDDACDPERFWRQGNGLGWHMLTEKGLQLNQKRGGTNGFSTVIAFNSRHKLGAAVFTNVECNPLDIALMPLHELAPVFRRLEDQSHAETVKASAPALRKYVGTYRLKSGADRPPCDEVVFVLAKWEANAPLHTASGATSSGINLNMRIQKPGSPDFRIYRGNDVFLERWKEQTFRIMSDTFEHDFLHFVEGENGAIVGFRWRTYYFEKAPG
jgi:CubicO group peptidase (beta-lactamase class C family)